MLVHESWYWRIGVDRDQIVYKFIEVFAEVINKLTMLCWQNSLYKEINQILVTVSNFIKMVFINCLHSCLWWFNKTTTYRAKWVMFSLQILGIIITAKFELYKSEIIHDLSEINTLQIFRNSCILNIYCAVPQITLICYLDYLTF